MHITDRIIINKKHCQERGIFKAKGDASSCTQIMSRVLVHTAECCCVWKGWGRRQLLAWIASAAARTTACWGLWTPLTSHRSQALVLICKTFEGTVPGSSCSSGLTDTAQPVGPCLAGVLPPANLGENLVPKHTGCSLNLSLEVQMNSQKRSVPLAWYPAPHSPRGTKGMQEPKLVSQQYSSDLLWAPPASDLLEMRKSASASVNFCSYLTLVIKIGTCILVQTHLFWPSSDWILPCLCLLGFCFFWFAWD